MTSKPTGTVTFLFTDIEGSTKLARERPEEWEALSAWHQQMLCQAIGANRGYVFHMIGDAFCAAFQTAGDAVRAAVQAQQGLHKQKWGNTQVKVRMGIHTGKAEFQENGDYQGYLTLSHTQRLMSAAYGGQVLLSVTTRDLVLDDLIDGVALRDLGSQRLKDLVRPEHIYQLVIPDISAEFPPIKTLDYYHHNLPAQMTSFIGREKEISEIKQVLQEHRLVTLVGAGGTGKTRLSLQVAADLLDHFPDGVWFVELAPLTNPDLIPQALLSMFGITEMQNLSVLDALVQSIREKKLLLLLDNCEHLIDACAKVVDTLLNNIPDLTILATSREALGVSGELAWYVPSLALPDIKHLPDVEQLSKYEAVRLFIERSTLVQPRLQMTKANAYTIAQICVRLDGIPLAIELAAARVKSLSVEQIAARLDDRFHLLTAGTRTALPRQQTLQAAIDWSYNLLSEDECALLQRLSVFSGGWSLEAAEIVCAGGDADQMQVFNVLTNLVNKSLVIFNPDNERYDMLETVKQYARDKLAADGTESVYLRAHMEYFLALAEQAERYQAGEEQINWLNRLEMEHDNFRVALDRLLKRGENNTALRLAGTLGQFWWVHNHLKEGREWLRSALDSSKEFTNKDHEKGVYWSSVLARQQGDYQTAKVFGNESLRLCRTLGDREGMARAFNNMGVIYYFERDLAEAQKYFNEALEMRRLLGDQVGIAGAINNLAIVIHTRGNLAEASVLYEESLEMCRQAGEKWNMAHVLLNMGHIAYEQRNFPRARTLYEEDVRLCRELGDRDGLAYALSGLAHLVCEENHWIEAARLQGAVISLLAEVGTSLEPIEKFHFDKTTITLKEKLSEVDYQKEVEIGKLLSSEEAIDLALKER